MDNTFSYKIKLKSHSKYSEPEALFASTSRVYIVQPSSSAHLQECSVCF